MFSPSLSPSVHRMRCLQPLTSRSRVRWEEGGGRREEGGGRREEGGGRREEGGGRREEGGGRREEGGGRREEESGSSRRILLKLGLASSQSVWPLR